MSVQVLSLPSLQPLARTKLQALTGWAWDWERAVLPCADPTRRCAACLASSRFFIVGPCQELLQLHVGSFQQRQPAQCSAFFNSDLAFAAYAAECKDAQARAKHRKSVDRNTGNAPTPPASGLTGLLRTVDQTLKSTLPQQGWFSKGAAPEPPATHMRHGEHLLPLFDSTASTSPARTPAKSPVPAPAQRPAPTVSGQGQHPPQQQQQHHQHQQRSGPGVQLPPHTSRAAAAAAPSAADVASSKGQVLTRSASEIRRAYGRPAPDRAARAGRGVAGTKEVMQDNVVKLNQRGERLQGLEAKMDDFVSDAESFAAMTKQLQQQANKSWWKR